MSRRGPLLPSVLPLLLALALPAQGPPANGPRTVDAGWHALVGADVVTRPGARIPRATVVVREGRIVQVQPNGKAPAGARVWDCTGLTIYPGLIDAFVPVDAPAAAAGTAGTHWNRNVQAQRSALDGPGVAEADRKALRGLGFTTAAIVPTGGVWKGRGAVVQLTEPAADRPTPVLQRHSGHIVSFQTGGDYPDSQMGAIAVLRQLLLDADWRERCQATVAQRPELGPLPFDPVLDALSGRDRPLWFDTQDELEVLRAAKIAQESGRRAVAVGSGMEFRRLPAVAQAGLPLVIPLDYPEAPDVGTVAAAERTSLRQLMSWEQAPTNTRRLLDAGAVVAWTTARLKDRGDFPARAAEAMACGVSADEALAAVTTTPAKLLGLDALVGTIEPGRLANLVAVRGALFERGAEVRLLFVGGEPHDLLTDRAEALLGKWTAALGIGGGVAATIAITGERVTLQVGEQEIQARAVRRAAWQLDFTAQHAAFGVEGHLQFTAVRDGDRLHGTIRLPDGSTATWTAVRSEGPAPLAAREGPALPPPAITPLPMPFEAYGLPAAPVAQNIVFRQARIWTSGPAGILERGALWIRDGKIAYVGPDADLPPVPAGTASVDLQGRQITPGIIDCHSHTGISRGINEAGQAVTSEVRVEDVINPDDVNWYRQLAGGVTAVNQLHGSANAIGGQSSTVKVRWGASHPDEMVLQGGRPGIKFALGENPRRANGSNDSTRYPATRMGVEALIRDRFMAARDHREAWRRYEALDARARAAVLPPRRDLELEALVEVLDGTRLLHCHSYRQDEISMLCGMAQELGFRIGTFQHVLEGYKVADAIAKAAIGASAFSDWWAYKLEVQDAIPDNGAIMHGQGVLVSFNSDSNELARRLNTEAGKAVKYGGLEPAAALAFVTINPARQLGIDQMTGSLEQGKDADFAIWSGDPLSYLSRCEATYVDGRPLFTLERDRDARAEVARERARLLQRALAAGGGAGRREGGRGGPAWDAFWRAEDLTEHYCCRECLGGGR